MREDQLLKAIATRSAALTDWPGVIIGPGDDAAVLRVDREPTSHDTPTPTAAHGNLLITTDQVIEGRHIEALNGKSPDADWLNRAARKAIARSISDIAAMGGRPLAAVATGALPTGNAWTDEHANQLFERMKHWAETMRCPLVGGDIATTPGPAVLTTTILGTPHPTRGPVLRSTAQPGDTVWVTGKLGGSLASGHHWSFTPRIEEAIALCDALGQHLHAMMDLSDGLGTDAPRLAEASRVSITLDAECLPKHPGVDPDHHWRQALGDGEDYELLFTIAADIPDEIVHQALRQTNTPATRIGAVAEHADSAPHLTIIDAQGNTRPVQKHGWLHE